MLRRSRTTSRGTTVVQHSRTFKLAPIPAAVLTVATLALAGCGGSGSPAASATSAPPSSAPATSAPASPVATASTTTTGKPTAAPPAGYQWVGITAKDIWLAVPVNWVVMNLNSLSVTQAMDRVRLKGQPATAMRAAIEGLKRNHGLMVLDTASMATSPSKFATNLNTFCTTSPIEPGPGAASAIESGTKTAYAKAGGHVIAVRDIADTASSVIVRIEVDLQTSTGQVSHELQYVDVTSQGQICYTTFSTDRPSTFFPVFEKIAATIHSG
jgi:hypothetical protein